MTSDQVTVEEWGYLFCMEDGDWRKNGDKIEKWDGKRWRPRKKPLWMDEAVETLLSWHVEYLIAQ